MDWRYHGFKFVLFDLIFEFYVFGADTCSVGGKGVSWNILISTAQKGSVQSVCNRDSFICARFLFFPNHSNSFWLSVLFPMLHSVTSGWQLLTMRSGGCAGSRSFAPTISLCYPTSSNDGIFKGSSFDDRRTWFTVHLIVAHRQIRVCCIFILRFSVSRLVFFGSSLGDCVKCWRGPLLISFGNDFTFLWFSWAQWSKESEPLRSAWVVRTEWPPRLWRSIQFKSLRWTEKRFGVFVWFSLWYDDYAVLKYIVISSSSPQSDLRKRSVRWTSGYAAHPSSIPIRSLEIGAALLLSIRFTGRKIASRLLRCQFSRTFCGNISHWLVVVVLCPGWFFTQSSQSSFQLVHAVW